MNAEILRVAMSVFVLLWLPFYLYFMIVRLSAEANGPIWFILVVPQVALAFQSLYIFVSPNSAVARKLVSPFKWVAAMLLALFGLITTLGSYYAF